MSEITLTPEIRFRATASLLRAITLIVSVPAEHIEAVIEDTKPEGKNPNSAVHRTARATLSWKLLVASIAENPEPPPRLPITVCSVCRVSAAIFWLSDELAICEDCPA